MNADATKIGFDPSHFGARCAWIWIATCIGLMACYLLIERGSEFHLIPALAAIYIAKLVLWNERLPPVVEGIAYLGVVCSLLAYVYTAGVDWGSPDLSIYGKLYLLPLMLFPVPTVTLLLDLQHDEALPRLTWRYMMVRTLFEIFILVPLWLCLCVFAAMHVFQSFAF